jgi:enoyl-CoA hydratase/carnithine racemase
MDTVHVERVREDVALVTLNRPAVLNAETLELVHELHAVLDGIAADPTWRVVVLTGAGRGFCAGHDLSEMPSANTDAAAQAGRERSGVQAGMRVQEAFADLTLRLHSLPQPVIAAVNGPAAGGGLALALAADIRIAAPEAKFNAAFVRIGLSAGDLGTSWLLTRLIGPAATSEICFTGRPVPAAEALAVGLVNAVSAPAALLDDALSLALAIAANSPGGVQLSKRAIQANMEAASYAAAIELENRGQALLTRGEDMPEALAALREKRAPVFTGR